MSVPGAKKILILDTGREWGGGTNSLLELLKRADRKRYSFSALFYKNYPRGSSSDIKTELERLGVGFILLGREKGKPHIKALKEAGRTLLAFTPGLKKRYISSLDYKGRVLPDAKRIASALKDGGFDLLYMNNQPSSNLEGILASEAAGVPCIQHSRVDVSLTRFEADTVNRAVKKVICVSRGVADSLVKSGVEAGLIEVVYNGIDPAFKPRKAPADIRKGAGIKDGTFVFGTVGSLIKRKRVELLIEAAAGLKGIDTVCLIVGSGPEEASLKALAARLGIEEKVIFTGFSDDALSYINAMDLFVLPSLKEGLPRVILEAMLMSRGVVAFDVVGTAELVVDGRTGLLIKEESARALSEGIKKLFEDRGLLSRMGEEGKRMVLENFGINKYIKGVEAVFEEVLR